MYIKDNGIMIESVVKVNLDGQMETHMMVNGKTARKMDMVLVKMLKWIYIKENGNQIKNKEKELNNGLMVINMMDFGKMI